MFDKIKNPKTGRWVNTNSALGKKIINNYKNQVAGGAPEYVDAEGWTIFRSNNDNKNAYEILGIEPNASQEEIKKTSRRLMLKWHVDKVPGSTAAPPALKEEYEEMFKKINTAYNILYDNSQGSYKDLYDDWLRQPVLAQAAQASQAPQAAQAAQAQPEITHEEALHITNHWYIHVNTGLTSAGDISALKIPLETDIVSPELHNTLFLALRHHLYMGHHGQIGAMFITDVVRGGRSIINDGINSVGELLHDDNIKYVIVQKNPESNVLKTTEAHERKFIVIEPKLQIPQPPPVPAYIFGLHNTPPPDPHRLLGQIPQAPTPVYTEVHYPDAPKFKTRYYDGTPPFYASPPPAPRRGSGSWASSSSTSFSMAPRERNNSMRYRGRKIKLPRRVHKK